MDGIMPTSPEFRADPLSWTRSMCERLMAPDVELNGRDREFVVDKRRHFGPDTRYAPGPVVYDQLCRIARRAGLLPDRPPMRKRSVNEAAQREARAVTVPAPFRVGAQIPKPPPLRRPVVALYDGHTESWDPAGSPGL